MRSLIEAMFPGGNVGLLYEWTDISIEPWEKYLLPLAELLAVSHPEAVWMATPVPDGMSDKEAISGHKH